MVQALAHFIAGWLVSYACFLYLRYRDLSGSPVDLPIVSLLAMGLSLYGPLATAGLVLRL